MRDLHPDTLAALKTDHYRATLLKLDFIPTPIYLTDCVIDIEYAGNTYLANGKFLGLGNVKQDIDIKVSNVNVTLDAVENSLVSIMLNNSQNSREVSVSTVILNKNYDIVGEPIAMQSLIVNGTPKISDDRKGGKAIITQALSTEFANWSKTNGRRTTTASQQKHFPNDTGFDFAVDSGKEVKWGRK